MVTLVVTNNLAKGLFFDNVYINSYKEYIEKCKEFRLCYFYLSNNYNLEIEDLYMELLNAKACTFNEYKKYVKIFFNKIKNKFK